MVQAGPFFTDIDSRIAVKGSRNPLGIQPLWTQLGRHVVGNLTTVSTSIRDFTTLIVGLWFVERVADIAPKKSEVDTFLQWEQLAAYARVAVNEEGSIRGIERVSRALEEKEKIVISAERAYQILADQKTYGLWGLYRGPAQVSGLVDSTQARLQAKAREFVEKEYISMLTQEGFRDGKEIVSLLAAPSSRIDLQGRNAPLINAIARILHHRLRAAERPFYYEHLVCGGPKDETEGRQRELAKYFTTAPFDDPDFGFTPGALVELAKRGRNHEGPKGALAYYSDRIRHWESVVAPASMIFSYRVAREKSTVEETANILRENLGFKIPTIEPDLVAELEAELSRAYGNAEVGKRWTLLAHALHAGEYAHAIRLLLAQNAFVMKYRNGSAWIEEREGKLDVRFHAESGKLPEASELATLWIFPYFLGALRQVALKLK